MNQNKQLNINPPDWIKNLAEEVQRAFPPKKTPKRFLVRKGVYRFKTFEEADRWWDSVIAESLRIEAKLRRKRGDNSIVLLI
jgi:hypothetical protein